MNLTILRIGDKLTLLSNCSLVIEGDDDLNNITVPIQDDFYDRATLDLMTGDVLTVRYINVNLDIYIFTITTCQQFPNIEKEQIRIPIECITTLDIDLTPKVRREWVCHRTNNDIIALFENGVMRVVEEQKITKQYEAATYKYLDTGHTFEAKDKDYLDTRKIQKKIEKAIAKGEEYLG